MQHIQRIWQGLAFVILVILFASCNSGSKDRAQVVGLWGMGYITSNGQPVQDGKEWFEFHEDGTVMARSSPFTYQNGYWQMDPEAHTLTLGEEGLDSLVYQYTLANDTLKMETVMKVNNHHVGICLVKIAKRPIEMENEMKGSVPLPVDSLK